MASKTKILNIRRKKRRHKKGRRRKRMLQSKGSTPSFPIHLESKT